MANGGWSSYGTYGTSTYGTSVAGLTSGMYPGTCNGNNTAVAGLAGGTLNNCYGPPFFFQKLQAFQGIPVCICTENSRCVMGQIIEICADYLTFNNNGVLEIIPLFQITRLSLAPTFGPGTGL